MNGLALITDMESIKVGNKDFMPDGRKLSSRHLEYIPKGNGSYRRTITTDLYIDGQNHSYYVCNLKSYH